MGQECSCLNYRQRRYRRTSDDPYPNHSDEEELQEGNQIDIMLDSHCENTSLLTAIADTTFSTTNESISMDDRLTKRDSTNKMSPYSSSSFNVSSSSCVHPSGPHKDDTTRSTSSKSNINLEVLRSYQKTTGIVDMGQGELECVMCLDIFSEENPKVRTLCNCGMNRTNFHMSCLMEWLNRDANCPVCRAYLFYEDE